ncbi:strigolactone esterase D14 [Prunus yedoensis var. nudiflora]|uniref:Strigolactone esterase D14 n=1 Tax=Prunus yedoensis var. nudiflora TaxID=2094558 RepID=A0A314Z2D5_PRUYE|nr:strigolactone esterase D14 [Prunus yedoensis var. nudiflora]
MGSSGSEETIVLAHGYGTDQSVWDKIVPYLAEHYRVVVFDWPFSGAVNNKDLFDPSKYSSYDAFANDLIALLDELNLKSTVFVGHSMSGMIGCIASINRPDLFKTLILVGASPRYINTEDYEGGLEMSDITQIISAIESDYHNWAAYFASLAVDANDPLSVDKFVKCLRRMRPEVSTPCTIINTSSDIVAPNSVAFYMQKKIKGKSTVEIINTNGHFPQLTAHLELLDVLGKVLGLKFDHQDPYIIGVN